LLTSDANRKFQFVIILDALATFEHAMR
jgi:hypothetical protein